MSIIFSTATDTRTRARKNVRIIAQVVHLQAPPTLETLQARLDALHDTRPRRFSLLDQLFEKREQDRC